MKKIFLYFIVFALTFSCNKIVKPKTKDFTYIISFEEKKRKGITDSINKSGHKQIILPFIPNGVSLECNLILDKNDNLYFYSQEIILPSACNGTDREKDTLVEFLHIQPKDITETYLKEIKHKISPNLNKTHPRFVLASQKDTIPSKIMNEIYKLKIPTYVIRRTTQEEDSVLFFKQNNMRYDSKTIKWDKTKMNF